MTLLSAFYLKLIFLSNLKMGAVEGGEKDVFSVKEYHCNPQEK